MLLVIVDLAISPQDSKTASGNIRLVARDKIPKNTPVWRLAPLTCDRIVGSPNDYAELFATFIRQNGFLDEPGREWIILGDNARFIRHRKSRKRSLDPLSEPNLKYSNHAGLVEWIAVREIAAGEELTIDMGSFAAEFTPPPLSQEGTPILIDVPPPPPVVVPPESHPTS